MTTDALRPSRAEHLSDGQAREGANEQFNYYLSATLKREWEPVGRREEEKTERRRTQRGRSRVCGSGRMVICTNTERCRVVPHVTAHQHPLVVLARYVFLFIFLISDEDFLSQINRRNNTLFFDPAKKRTESILRGKLLSVTNGVLCFTSKSSKVLRGARLC